MNNERKSQENRKSIKTFPIPIQSGDNKEDISISSYNYLDKLSEEEITNKAFEFHSKGNITEAYKYYKFFINKGYENHIVFSNYGTLLKGQGNLKEAELFTRKAIKIKPDYAIAFCNLGSILIDQKKLKEAERLTREAINIDPYLSEAHSNLGSILIDQGKFKEAELFTCKAIEVKPTWKIYLNYAISLYNNMKSEDAKKMLQKAVYIANKEHTTNRLDRNILDASLKSIDFPKAKLMNTKFDKLVLNKPVENNLIKYLYSLKKVELNNLNDARFGKGKGSENFELFYDTSPIIKDLYSHLKDLCKQALNINEIFLSGSFFNIFISGSGAKPHQHLNKIDNQFNLSSNKYSLVYYLDIGDQSGEDPGILKLYGPDENILPEKGMIVIINAGRRHSASYRGTKDRVMVGFNFYGF